MTESEFIPDRLVSFNRIDHNSYVLDIIPQQNDDDFYYEIFISSDSKEMDFLNNSIGEYIFVEIISPTELEIWEGEWLHECGSIVALKYFSYERKKTPKRNKEMWKSKVKQLEIEYRGTFSKRLREYRRNRLDVLYRSKELYESEISTYSNEELRTCGAALILNLIFPSIYSDAAWYSFSTFVEPAFKIHKKADKDWKEAYSGMKQKYDIVTNIDLSDHSKIKAHTIQLYKREFENRLWSDLANHPYLEKEKYTDFFEKIILKIETDLRSF